MTKTVPIDLEYVETSDSGMACLFRDEDGEEEWLPLSQIPDFNDQDHEDGDFVLVNVPEWLAKRIGWI